jgi:hypothetical protein
MPLNPVNYSSGPSGDAFAVAPSNTASYAGGVSARALYVGTAGDVSLVTAGGTTVLFKNVPAGSWLPVVSSRVNLTGTTAGALVGLR